MTTQDIRDRLLRVTRELLECVAELESAKYRTTIHMDGLSPSGDDVIVHETKREPVVNCEKCGMRLNPGAVICWCCGSGRQ